MRGRTIFPITAGCLVLAAAATFLYRCDTEPSYNGRSLAQWIKASSQNPADPEAHAAIICITTNSAPLLLRSAVADINPPFNLINKLPFSAIQHPFLRRLLYREDEISRAACAIRAFEIAGTNAAPAVPALAAMMTDQNPQVTIEAIHLCSFIGPPALPAIRRAMTSQHTFIRAIAIGSLKRLGTNATEATPDVVNALSDYDINVRRTATNVLETLDPAALAATAAPAP